MIEADAFLASLARVEKESEGETIRSAVVDLKDIMVGHKFEGVPLKDARSIIKGFWEFILFASQQTYNPVRIATMRSTVLILHRLYYIYPKELSETFEEVSVASTVELRPSLLLAGVFGILSYFRLPWLCTEFQEHCPVFHHFSKNSNSDSDMVAGVISLYKHLGSEFHENLIDLFLSQIETDSNKSAERAIPILVKQSQTFFTTLEKLKKMVGKWHCLVVASEILKQIDADMMSTLDITPFLEESLKVLSCEKEISASYLDAAFSILTTENLYNDLIVEVADTVLKLTFGGATTELNIDKFVSRPAFYQMNLPIEMMFPVPGDGVTLMSAKFAGLIRNLPKCDEESLEKVMKFLGNEALREYDPQQSALMEAILVSVPKITDESLSQRLFHTLIPLVFRQSVSWFHDKDKLGVIAAFQELVLGESMREEILEKLIGFIYNENDRLSLDAQRVLVDTLMTDENCASLVYKLARACDMFCPLSFRRTLDVFARVGKKFHVTVIPLFFIHEMIEMFDLYGNDRQMFLSMCAILSLFRKSELPMSVMMRCVSVVVAAYEAATGEKGPKLAKVSERLIDEGKKIVADSVRNYISDFSDPKFDKKGKKLVAAAAISVISVCQNFPSDLLWPVVQCGIRTYPLPTVEFVYRHWKSFSTAKQVEFLSSYHDTMSYLPGIEIFQTWLQLFSSCWSPDNAQSLASCQDHIRSIIHASLRKGGWDLPTPLVLAYLRFYSTTVKTETFPFHLLCEEAKSRIKAARGRRGSIQSRVSLRSSIVLNPQPVVSSSQMKTPPMDLQTMITEALKSSDDATVKNLLTFASECHMLVNIEDLDWPLRLFGVAEAYLKHVNPESYKSFCLKHRAAAINAVLEEEKPKRQDLMIICRCISLGDSLSDADALKLLEYVLSRLSNSAYSKRKTLLLTLGTICTHMCSTIPLEVASEIVKVLIESHGRPTGIVSRFLSEFCKHVVPKGRPKSFLASLKDVLSSQGYVNSYYLMANIYSHLKISNLGSFISSLLEADIPSFYCSAIRLLNACVRLPKYGDPCPIIRQLLPQMISTRNTYGRNGIVHKCFSYCLSHIFHQAACQPVVEVINTHRDEITPHYNASFYSYVRVVPCFSPVNAKHAQRLNFRGYERYYRYCIERITSQRKSNSAIEYFRKWVANIDRFDNTTLSDSLLWWLEFLSKSSQINELLPEFGQVPRFFPLFVALQRFMRANGINIEHIAALLKDHTTVHVVAFETAAAGDMQRALQLALFDEDCEAASAVMSQI